MPLFNSIGLHSDRFHTNFILTGSILIIAAALTACGTTESSTELSEDEHLQVVEQWHAERIEGLKETDGWLKLAGLFWLDEGVNTFGSASGNDVRFPEGTVPANAGYYELDGETVTLHRDQSMDITLEDGSVLQDSVIFSPDVSKTLQYGELTWTVIQREDLIGIRLFDENSPYYTGFEGFDRYPVDINWRFEADFVPHEDKSTIEVTNILGQTVERDSPGKLVFEVDGEEHSLAAIDTGDSFFIPFADATNRDETYGSGRFIYTDLPDEEGKVTIDFNKAYNPPCAYNPYTTCQLPPEPNRLSISITAGEKDYPLTEVMSER